MPSNRITALNRRRLLVGAAATSTLFCRAGDRAGAERSIKGRRVAARSGTQAGIGQIASAVDIAAGILKDLQLPCLTIMLGDTKSSLEVAPSGPRSLIGAGAQLLIGALDSGQTTAMAQVAEQRGIPLVINIAAAPPITEQGYKFVFRNFPRRPRSSADAFDNQKQMFAATGKAPKQGRGSCM